LDRRPQPGNAGHDQQSVGAGAEKHQWQDVFASDTLAKHVGVLGTNGDDEDGTGQESGNQVCGHDLSVKLAMGSAYGAPQNKYS
jgi:hypothetical protein